MLKLELLRKYKVFSFIDYKLVFSLTGENSKGGRPSDKFMLNIRTFKKCSLKKRNIYFLLLFKL
jgi:hypothetical protein